MAACSNGVEAFLLAPERGEEHQTRLVAIRDTGGVEATIFGLDQPPEIEARFSRPLPGDELTDVYVLDYVETLTDLAIAPGTLPAAGADERPCALATPSTVRRASLGPDGVVSGWITIVDRDIDLAVVRHLIDSSSTCVGTNRCRTTSFTTLPLDDAHGNVELIVALDDDTALVATQGQRFFLVDATDATPQPFMDGIPSWSGTKAPSGALWFGGRTGRIASGPDRRSLAETKVGDDNEIVMAILVRADDDVFALLTDEPTTRTRLLHFDGTTWTELVQRALDFDISPSHGALVAIDGGAVIAGYGADVLWHIDSALKVSLLRPPAFIHASIAYHQTVGVLVGTNFGRPYASTSPRDEIWQPIGGTLAATVEALAVAEDAIYYGAAGGNFSQFWPDSVECPVVRIGNVDMNLITIVGARLLVGGGNVDGSRPNLVAWIDLD